MVSEKMKELGSKRSVIRDLFEYGKLKASEVGEENVYDFSLGNPSVPAPKSVEETITKLIKETEPTLLHGYTSAQGDALVRKTLADNLKKRFDAPINENLMYMTCGAAASLTITLHALAEKDDEFIAFTPFFPEYRVFVEGTGSKLVCVDTVDGSFQIDGEAFEKAITKNTKGVIVNTPNNPSGVVLNEESANTIVEILEKKQKEYSHPIFLITDEPYRELIYSDVKNPCFLNLYNNTVLCYSYSKSLSLPGERIGYIAVSDKAENKADLYASVCGAGRVLGYVCAPSLMQRVVAACDGETGDLDAYRGNRDILYNALTEMGFECVYPDGAFYLFVKSPIPSAEEFSNKAKEYNLLIVPADSFGVKGYVRLSYCVATDMIKRSLPKFEELMKNYK
ncbi:MAG: pyridoxal phosphate-dependent aminotransferase [Ruminococcaceae bacterium]|nr:pyridoxal phosphate-dependent aminotransferase [Oscillospiraceae bacterium]